MLYLNYTSNTAGVLLKTGRVLPFKTSCDNFRLLVRSVLLIVFCVMFCSLDCLFLLSSSGFFLTFFFIYLYTGEKEGHSKIVHMIIMSIKIQGEVLKFMFLQIFHSFFNFWRIIDFIGMFISHWIFWMIWL